MFISRARNWYTQRVISVPQENFFLKNMSIIIIPIPIGKAFYFTVPSHTGFFRRPTSGFQNGIWPLFRLYSGTAAPLTGNIMSFLMWILMNCFMTAWKTPWLEIANILYTTDTQMRFLRSVRTPPISISFWKIFQIHSPQTKITTIYISKTGKSIIFPPFLRTNH